MSPTPLPRARRDLGLTGRHVLIAIVGFFAIVFSVNGVLLYQALSTHSGVIANEPYRKGLNYNSRISASELQQALGWQDTVTVDAGGLISLQVVDARSAPVAGLVLTGVLGRPSTTRHDRKVVFRETAAGHYVSDIKVTDGGSWLLALEALRTSEGAAQADAEPIYRMKKRLWQKS